MAHYKIQHRLTGAVLYEGEAETLRDLVATAVKSGASLDGASLRNASLVGASVLPGGVTFKEFVDDVVPALLGANPTLPLAHVVTEEQWACHSWSNCPMHAVFGVERLSDVPAVWRSHAELFIRLFDDRVLTLAMVQEACGLITESRAASPTALGGITIRADASIAPDRAHAVLDGKHVGTIIGLAAATRTEGGRESAGSAVKMTTAQMDELRAQGLLNHTTAAEGGA